MKGLYNKKLNIKTNQALDPNGGDIIENKIILPKVRFETNVLMNTPFGKFKNLNGGILMRIQKEFWIGIIIFTTISWCFAFYIIWIIY